MATFNIDEDSLHTIVAILDAHIPDAEVRVFGSRLSNRARPFSDIDLLVVNPTSLSLQKRIDLIDAFEQSDLEFCVDLLEVDKAPLTWRQDVLANSIDIRRRIAI
jgi:uncharacterized protein